ncbi:MAG: hypothetical protein A3J58_03625 [Candidatus Sungbacteria bacterium RIFCSPHIGHO2_02_FULL_52_23]|uniref:Uncharacterized protein n=1 Tax=Candidatus Sungbacteria bacterium RIFCSPHIGHO2_02_FULL_52_23 TaxID=1802274 RepID=A0A1G2KVI8_9BACT|nr:MAG: hypothetical protein A3J58_03625 [Candidatus Sungbacteria bacterium RIFCSPHIGHO2_02_FULL_52_23]
MRPILERRIYNDRDCQEEKSRRNVEESYLAHNDVLCLLIVIAMIHAPPVNIIPIMKAGKLNVAVKNGTTITAKNTSPAETKISVTTFN